MSFSFFKTRREVLDWMTAIGWYITNTFDASGRPVYLLLTDDGDFLCQGTDEDCCLAWAGSYAAGVVDEYNHHKKVAELAGAAFSIRLKRGDK